MCSQADDPSQHVSDDPLRVALERAYRDGLIFNPDDNHQWCDEDSGGNHVFDSAAWLDDVAAALAASATDEGPYCTLECTHSLWEPHPAASATEHVHTAACHSENCVGTDHD